MNIKTTLKTSVAAAALLAVAAPVVSSPAQAGLANGNDNGVVMSGSVNRSVMYTDNGNSNNITHNDGGTDNSRLRFIVSGQLTESIAVGGVWEANLPFSNAQGSVTNANTQGGITEGGSTGFGYRKANVSFTHATMGKLSIGMTETGSDNKPSLDSTTNNNAGITHGGGMLVFNKTAQTHGSSAGGHFASYFGGKKDAISYATPNIAGFGVKVATAQDFWDIGLTYGATYGDITIAAAVQHAENGSTNTHGAGLAVLHASGVSAGAHWGAENKTDGATSNISGSAWGVEAGYTTTAVSNLGATSFSVVYARADETSVDDYTAKTWSLHVKQSLPAAVDVYASYENASFDDGTANDLEDLTVALIGTKISF